MRQLIVTTDVAPATANGLIVYKKVAATGAQAVLVAGDTQLSAPEIKFCRNGSGECSPWIMGSDLIKWSGVSGLAQVAGTINFAFTTATLAGGMATVKVLDMSSGSEPYVRESFEFAISTVAATNGANARAAAAAHIAAVGYNGMISAVGGAGVNLLLTTHTYAGPSAIGYNKQSNLAGAFDNDGDATLAAVVTLPTLPTSTLGDLFVMQDFEKELLGSNKGDYYRLQQPDPTVTYTNMALTKPYDVYTLTWGSRYKQGQINKVDNVHELYLATVSAPATFVNATFQTIMNGYLASTMCSNLPVVAL